MLIPFLQQTPSQKSGNINGVCEFSKNYPISRPLDFYGTNHFFCFLFRWCLVFVSDWSLWSYACLCMSAQFFVTRQRLKTSKMTNQKSPTSLSSPSVILTSVVSPSRTTPRFCWRTTFMYRCIPMVVEATRFARSISIAKRLWRPSA